MVASRWTWSAAAFPRVDVLLRNPPPAASWFSSLDGAPSDGVVAKVLCVSAAASIARAYQAVARDLARDDEESLDLLEAWIDDPTKQRFDTICRLIFGEDDEDSGQGDVSYVTWWALRCATASVEGCGEIEWIFDHLCEGLVEEGFDPDWVRDLGLEGVQARREPEE